MKRDILDIKSNIVDTLEKIRPFIRRDGGDIEFVDFDEEEGIVHVRLLGACVGCSLVDTTISEGVEIILKEEVEEVKGVKLVDF